LFYSYVKLNMIKSKINIGIIGEYDAKKTSHTATNEAIRHAAAYLGIEVVINWLATTLFLEKQRPEQFDAFWASPGSPYQSPEGAIWGIKLVREMDRPFIAT
jgi:CTP synthase (UTP-ammonia lyase)